MSNQLPRHPQDIFHKNPYVAEDHGFGYAYALPIVANTLSAKDLAHPCITGAVSNDVKMDTAQNMIFLTGANMAGKSTLMKSIGIARYLCHTGFPVAAGNWDAEGSRYFCTPGTWVQPINLLNFRPPAGKHFGTVFQIHRLPDHWSDQVIWFTDG